MDYIKFANPNPATVGVYFNGQQVDRLGRHDCAIKPQLEEPYSLLVVDGGLIAKVVVTDMPDGIEADQWIVDVTHKRPTSVLVRTNEDLKNPRTPD